MIKEILPSIGESKNNNRDLRHIWLAGELDSICPARIKVEKHQEKRECKTCRFDRK